MEWILNKQFKSPAEWFGDEGIKFRAHWCKNPKVPKRLIREFEAFLEEHRDTSLADVDAILRDRATEKEQVA